MKQFEKKYIIINVFLNSILSGFRDASQWLRNYRLKKEKKTYLKLINHTF